MIRGYFSTVGATRRPFVYCALEFPIPSLLGRDFMSNFALFMEEGTGKVLFLDEEDLSTLGLSILGQA